MRSYMLLGLVFLFVPHGYGQETVSLRLTLGEAIVTAQRQSPEILVARHSFRSVYWNYCFYKANYLPSLLFTSTPNFNHRINVVSLADGTSEYVGQNQLETTGALTVTQNIPWTGGVLSVKTDVRRLDMFGSNRTHTYNANPVTVSYEQALFGYNYLKWDKRIEPLRFEEGKRNYVESLELVAAKTVLCFFNLAKAQANLQIARTNYANADTLSVFAGGRYGIGTITENEMLQLEVNRLTEESNMLTAQTDVDNYMQELRSFLGINEDVYLEVVADDDIPEFKVGLTAALEKALQNSPDIIALERRKRESDSHVAYARSLSGFKADIFAQFGLTQMGKELHAAYRNPLNQQYVEMGIRLPVLDWGRGRGRIRVARSNRDMVYTQVEQDRTNFNLNVQKVVKQFNLQSSRVKVADRTDYTANKRNDVARRLYLSGKSTILDLNSAITEKDQAKRNYIHTLYEYWTLYYTLRSLTLYDFGKDMPLTEDYELLLR